MQNYDQHRFSFDNVVKRFVEIMSRGLIPEWKVNLYARVYDDFHMELERQNWHQVLGDLPNEIYGILVKLFYVNAYQEVRSWPLQAKV